MCELAPSRVSSTGNLVPWSLTDGIKCCCKYCKKPSFVIHPLGVHEYRHVFGIESGIVCGIFLYGYTRNGGKELPFAATVANKVSARFSELL